VILAFPCNQFGGQEPGTNEEIVQFACTRFKAEYPIFDKVTSLFFSVSRKMHNTVFVSMWNESVVLLAVFDAHMILWFNIDLMTLEYCGVLLSSSSYYSSGWCEWWQCCARLQVSEIQQGWPFGRQHQVELLQVLGRQGGACRGSLCSYHFPSEHWGNFKHCNSVSLCTGLTIRLPWCPYNTFHSSNLCRRISRSCLGALKPSAVICRDYCTPACTRRWKTTITFCE
jgi:hypothetical protein